MDDNVNYVWKEDHITISLEPRRKKKWNLKGTTLCKNENSQWEDKCLPIEHEEKFKTWMGK